MPIASMSISSFSHNHSLPFCQFNCISFCNPIVINLKSFRQSTHRSSRISITFYFLFLPRLTTRTRCNDSLSNRFFLKKNDKLQHIFYQHPRMISSYSHPSSLPSIHPSDMSSDLSLTQTSSGYHDVSVLHQSISEHTTQIHQLIHSAHPSSSHISTKARCTSSICDRLRIEI